VRVETRTRYGCAQVRQQSVLVVVKSRRRVKSQIESDLWAWGRWLIDSQCDGLSYPPFSVEGRMMNNGGFAPSMFGSNIPRYYPNHYILKLNQQVCKLSEEDKELLICRYALELSYDAIGKVRSMSPRQVGLSLGKITDKLLKSRS
jgi:hypothetical protein